MVQFLPWAGGANFLDFVWFCQGVLGLHTLVSQSLDLNSWLLHCALS